MHEELITAIALIVACVISSFFYNRIATSATKKQRLIEKAKRSGHYTEGEHVDSKIHFGNRESNNLYMRSNTLKVKYRYRVNGIEYYKTLTFQDPGKVSIDYPYKVMVYYDPQNPKKAICPEEATKTQQMRTGCLSTIGVFVLVLFCVFHFLQFLLG